MKKYYEILELEENCSTADVKVAFIRKLKAIPKITKEKMLPYAQAYVVLSHPSERKKYDDLPETEYDFSTKYPSVSNPEKICDVILEELMFFEKNLHADFICARRDMVMGALGVCLGLFFIILFIIASMSIRVRIYIIIFGLVSTSAGVAIKGLVLYIKSVKKRIKFRENMWNSINL